jgi:hypothetical protein
MSKRPSYAYRRRKDSDDEVRYYLRCACGNRTFQVAQETVRAKRHTRSGRRFRVVATCLWCGDKHVVKYGGVI